MHKLTASASLRTGGVQQSQCSQYTDNISLQDPIQYTIYNQCFHWNSSQFSKAPNSAKYASGKFCKCAEPGLVCILSTAADFSNTICDTTFFQKKQKKSIPTCQTPNRKHCQMKSEEPDASYETHRLLFYDLLGHNKEDVKTFCWAGTDKAMLNSNHQPGLKWIFSCPSLIPYKL